MRETRERMWGGREGELGVKPRLDIRVTRRRAGRWTAARATGPGRRAADQQSRGVQLVNDGAGSRGRAGDRDGTVEAACSSRRDTRHRWLRMGPGAGQGLPARADERRDLAAVQQRRRAADGDAVPERRWATWPMPGGPSIVKLPDDDFCGQHGAAACGSSGRRPRSIIVNRYGRRFANEAGRLQQPRRSVPRVRPGAVRVPEPAGVDDLRSGAPRCIRVPRGQSRAARRRTGSTAPNDLSELAMKTGSMSTGCTTPSAIGIARPRKAMIPTSTAATAHTTDGGATDRSQTCAERHWDRLTTRRSTQCRSTSAVPAPRADL